ncbi:biotin-dependent carboxyltransferase family protein [Chitinilyticum litopenaei]|uniref:5-oxoprolinase subunit C family protein n=1 Tax=Chitinilyticum litopenaei TaxID=1121276 RepID=UPI00041C183C|nr:biotin-dependent carboxyltransferase family protein [Chitinilyticum litopenaei]
MTHLHILRPGMQASVQDLGSQSGFADGVAQGGAADALACRLANRLVGNADGDATLEITLGGLQLESSADCWLALTGAPCALRISASQGGAEGRDVPAWSAFLLRAGERLQLAAPAWGLRSYLAVAGGIAVPELLGSRATRLGSGWGGWQGRALRAGDVLPVGESGFSGPARRIRAPRFGDMVRILPGPQAGLLETGARRELAGHWRVDMHSNRMGARLLGPVLAARSASIYSHPVQPGAVQLTPAGQPIVLLADAQLTGGYPVIAQVIAADLWRCGQWRPGQSVRLMEVSEAAALAALREQRDWLAKLARVLPQEPSGE